MAIYPDGVVQRMRTGATSGLAAKYLAHKDARVAALLGTGWQAGSQAMAICAVRQIERIACYSPREDGRRSFAARAFNSSSISGRVRKLINGFTIALVSCVDDNIGVFGDFVTAVCTENPIRAYRMIESAKLVR